MRARRTILALIGVVVVVLLAVTTTSGPVDYTARAPSLPWDLPAPDLDVEVAGDADESSDEARENEESESALTELVSVAIVVAVAGLILWQIVILWRRRPRAPFGRSRQLEELEVLDDRLDALAADVQADAAEQRSALLRGEPRNAIVACWLRLETLVTDSGVERRISDTSTDLAVRTLGALDVDAAALGALAALYREARFSAHEMDETKRRAAIDALDVLHDGLRPRGPVAM